jgi:arylsulfatase A-like enzyme
VRKHALDRREFLAALGLGAVACATGRHAAAEQLPRKPNIILIMADDLGYGDLGCYGNEGIKTPHIDALARNGMRFTDFHSNGPVCSPTRAALLTGRYQQRCGIEGVVTAKKHRDTGMALDEITFAEMLGSAGYATALFGKWHVGYSAGFGPVKQGFDTFRGYVSGNVDYQSHIDQVGYEDWWRDGELVPEKGYTTDLITEHAVRFIERHKEELFCLYLPHEAPHYPYQGRHDKADRQPGNVGPTQGTPEDKTGAYKEMVEAMDDGVGRVVDTVQRLGLKQDTFVFFCSDNGANAVGSNGPLSGNKGSVWEGGHRVPAIACWPGVIKPGSVTNETAMTMDLLPTMAAIAGARVERKLDGVDLMPVLRDGGVLPERTLFWRFGKQKAVRMGPWKLVVNPRGHGNPEVGLYNLDEDVGEERDLSGGETERVREMEEALRRWEEDVTAGVTQRT